MKKIAFLSIIALSMGFVACDDFEYPNPPAQSNPQETVFASADLVLLPAAPAQVDLAAAPAPVTLATFGSAEGLPEGYTLSFVGQMSGNEDFGNPYDFNVAFDGSAITAAAADLDAAFRTALSTLDPSARNVWMRFKAYATSTEAGVPSARIGGKDAYYADFTTVMTPFAPEFTVSSSYWLIYSTDAETWRKSDAFAFTHSDRSPYDDPYFSVVCDLPAADLFWKVIPGETYETFDLAGGLVYGVPEADSESRSGKLDPSADQLAGYCDLDGKAMFEIDMRALTFSYKKAIEYFWLAGDDVNGNTWSFTTEPNLWTKNFENYAGFARLGSEFKFSPVNGWNGDFGSDGGLSFGMDGDQYIGTGTATGGKNINVGEPGLYYIDLYYPNRYLKLVRIDSWGIIGDFNGWGESVVMTKVGDDINSFVYTATVELNQGNGWKFRANGNWTVSLGGTPDRLDPFNGANIVCDATGTYEITLDITNIPWTATVVKK